jgi:hypothetical protein
MSLRQQQNNRAPLSALQQPSLRRRPLELAGVPSGSTTPERLHGPVLRTVDM